MSDHFQVVVDLAATADTAVRQAQSALDWMTESGIVVPIPGSRRADFGATYMDGPQMRSVLADRAAFDKYAQHQRTIGPPTHRQLWTDGVTVTRERSVFDPGENYEEPPCPRCGTPLVDHMGLFEHWWAGSEPIADCPACDFAALLGDWRHPFGIYVGHVGIQFNNWYMLDPAFLELLGERLGPRPRVIYQHL